MTTNCVQNAIGDLATRKYWKLYVIDKFNVDGISLDTISSSEKYNKELFPLQARCDSEGG